MEEQQIPLSRYLACLILLLLPLFMYAMWVFYLGLNHNEVFDGENSEIIYMVILPMAGIFLLMFVIFYLLRHTLLGYDKQRRNRRYARQSFQFVDIKLDKYEITTYLSYKKFDMIDVDLYYKKIKGGENQQETHEFVSIQKSNEVIEIFNEVVARKEPFENAYQQMWFKKHEKHLIIFTNSFEEIEKRYLLKQCYKWKSSAGFWIRQMPNEFWSPLIYVEPEEKLYHIPFMTSKYKIRHVVGKKIIKNKQP